MTGSHNRPYRTHEERKAAVGKEGRPIDVFVNHFGVSLQCKKHIYHYDVKMVFPPSEAAEAAWKLGKRARKPEERPLKKSDIDLAFETLRLLDSSNPGVILF